MYLKARNPPWRSTWSHYIWYIKPVYRRGHLAMLWRRLWMVFMIYVGLHCPGFRPASSLYRYKPTRHLEASLLLSKIILDYKSCFIKWTYFHTCIYTQCWCNMINSNDAMAEYIIYHFAQQQSEMDWYYGQDQWPNRTTIGIQTTGIYLRCRQIALCGSSKVNINGVSFFCVGVL